MLTPLSPHRRLIWPWLVWGAVVVLLASFGMGWALVRSGTLGATRSGTAGPGSGTALGRAAAGPTGTDRTCTYLPVPGGAPQERELPMPPSRAGVTAAVRATLATNVGTITLRLAGDVAPCAVNSFISLARNRYYDSTPCHRLTTRGSYVLQCGDPSGSGTGGPGYQYSDENLPRGRHPAYPRGTIAMANAGPNTNGSQFFLVFKDSDIDPNYSVFGTVTGGLDVLDKIATAGSDNSGGTGDGQPTLATTINSATVVA